MRLPYNASGMYRCCIQFLRLKEEEYKETGERPTEGTTLKCPLCGDALIFHNGVFMSSIAYEHERKRNP